MVWTYCDSEKGGGGSSNDCRSWKIKAQAPVPDDAAWNGAQSWSSKLEELRLLDLS
jgi:hypothetical protein